LGFNTYYYRISEDTYDKIKIGDYRLCNQLINLYLTCCKCLADFNEHSCLKKVISYPQCRGGLNLPYDAITDMWGL
jgi:hypothetical protein